MDGFTGGNGKSVASLEKEIMRLQDVLKDHENKITLLEGSLRAKESKAHGFTNSVPNIRTNGSAIASPVVRIESGESEEFVTPTEDRRGHEWEVSPHFFLSDSSGGPVSQDDESIQSNQEKLGPQRNDRIR